MPRQGQDSSGQLSQPPSAVFGFTNMSPDELRSASAKWLSTAPSDGPDEDHHRKQGERNGDRHPLNKPHF